MAIFIVLPFYLLVSIWHRFMFCVRWTNYNIISSITAEETHVLFEILFEPEGQIETICVEILMLVMLVLSRAMIRKRSMYRMNDMCNIFLILLWFLKLVEVIDIVKVIIKIVKRNINMNKTFYAIIYTM